MSPQISHLPLAAIRTDGGTQIRAELNQFLIDDYAAALEQGALFPPIVVYFDGQDYWLADGFHRRAAFRQAGLTEISAEIHAGTRRDALLYAVGANANHGLRRSNADKRRAALLLLEDGEWCHWSDREIARVAAVSHEFVRTLRARVSVNACQLAERSVRRGASTHSMSTRRIGGTQRLAPEVRDLLRDTSVAEDQAELLTLSRLKPNEQKEVAQRIASGADRTMKSAVRAAEAERREVQVQAVDGALAAPLPHPREIQRGGLCAAWRPKLMGALSFAARRPGLTGPALASHTTTLGTALFVDDPGGSRYVSLGGGALHPPPFARGRLKA
jgi:hypothetical protein